MHINPSCHSFECVGSGKVFIKRFGEAMAGSAGQTLLGLGILGMLYPLFAANSDYAFALFMDERITYEPISIVLKGGIADFAAFFFDGKDARYGRLMWNLDLAVSYLPFQLFGEKGQIVAVRYCHAITMLFAFILMCRTLKLPLWLQWLVLPVLMLLPPVFYYMLMPKPEPLILLVLALIMHCAAHKQKSCLLLLTGVLAGLKLSMLPIAAVLTVYFAFRSGLFSRQALADWFTGLKAAFTLRNIVVFLVLTAVLLVFCTWHLHSDYSLNVLSRLQNKHVAGIPLALAFTAMNAGVSALFCLMVLKTIRDRNQASDTLWILIRRLLTGFAISNPFVFLTPYNAALYLLTPVTQGSDNLNVGPSDWFALIYNRMFFGSAVLVTAFFSVSFLVLLYLSKTGTLKKALMNRELLFLSLILIGTLFPLLFLTKRLWDFYLLMPLVSLVLIYTLMLSKASTQRVLFISGFFPLLYYIFLALPVRQNGHSEVLNKSNSKEYQRRVSEYLKVVKIINSEFAVGDSCAVYWDPALFFPDLLQCSEVKLIWGPFKNWGERRQFVVLKGKPEHIYQPVKGSVMVNEMQLARDSFKRYANLYSLDTDSFRYYKIYRLK